MPLIIGGLLPLGSDSNGTRTLALITNQDLLTVHNGTASRAPFVPLEATGGGVELYGWANVPAGASPAQPQRFVAFFNAETTAQAASARFVEEMGFPAGTLTLCMRDLFAGTWVEPVGGPVGGAGPSAGTGVTVGVNPHGVRAFLFTTVGDPRCRTGAATIAA